MTGYCRMSDKDIDKIDSKTEKIDFEKEQVEMKLMEIENSVKIPEAVKDGSELENKLKGSHISGFKDIGIRETKIEDMAISGELKNIPKDAKAGVVKDLSTLRDIQDYRAKGFTKDEIISIGKEHKDIYSRFYESNVNNIKGTEIDGKVLIDQNGRTHVAYALEMKFKELPVHIKKAELNDRLE